MRAGGVYLSNRCQMVANNQDAFVDRELDDVADVTSSSSRLTPQATDTTVMVPKRYEVQRPHSFCF
jgi:hypothetical protein